MPFDNDNGVLPWVDNKLGRRGFLKAGLIAMGAGVVTMMTPPAFAAMRMPESGAFNVAFRNAHTGDSFNGTYRVGNTYLPDAFERINHVLRDFRTGEEFPIDPRSIDILYMVQSRTNKSPLDVLSGYRSPKTNSMLRNASAGVAKNSLHMVGQAIDIQLPGYSTRRVRDVAIDLRAGGVGYYPDSDFVHIDTGKVRHW
ncbi:MAG TPA: DUF882 domain-containing protein [Micavibrio sp.]